MYAEAVGCLFLVILEELIGLYPKNIGTYLFLILTYLFSGLRTSILACGFLYLKKENDPL